MVDDKDRNNLMQFLRKEGVSGVLVNRIGRLIGQFATMDAFFSASRGAILKAYKRITPDNDYGLGDSFWGVFNKANAFVKGKMDVEKEPKCAKEHEDAPQIDQKLMRMMTLEELRTVVSFMELCDVEAINILEITGFLSSVRMRQKKDVPEDGGKSAFASPEVK